jgi:hypothetical protein
VYGRQITAPLVAIWIEALGDYRVEILEGLFRKVLTACKFFPTPADVLEPMKKAEEAGAPLSAELKWHTVLDYANSTTPDFPDRNPPRISERTMAAIRAAGGIAWIRDCPADELQWARKRFVESYLAWDVFKRGEHLLPEGSIKNLIAGIAEAKELPASK